MKQHKKNDHHEKALAEVTPEAVDALQKLDKNEVLQKLDKETRAEVLSLFSIERKTFSGPIPHPDLLRGYEDIKEGFAERIVSMTEKQQEHRMECEKRLIKSTVSQRLRGQWMGLCVTMVFAGVAAWLGYLGHDWLAGTIFGGTIAAVAAIFVRQQNAVDKNKDKEKQ